MKVAISAAALAVALSVNLFGQALSGTVVGMVTDPTGAAVPGANVTVRNDGTGFVRTVQTNVEGQWRVDAFPTGSLTITVERSGFEKLVRSGVTLTTADIITVNMQLRVGSVTQTLEVTGEASLVQAQSAAVSTLVTREQIAETPSASRTFTQMLLLIPGVSGGTSLGVGISGFGSMTASTAVSINGATSQNNGYVVDGIQNRGQWLDGLVLAPPVDSVQEQRVMGSNYSAEFGAAAGAVTVVQTKSGTNAFHGTAYEFLRNDKLDANTFFNNKAGRPRPPYRRNQFGGNLGGPIRRDKLFFFADYDGSRTRQPSSLTQTIPTLAQQKMFETGDFSPLGKTIYDPFTSLPGGLRVPFAGNQIPLNRVQPVSRALMKLLPAPTTSGVTNNFTWSGVNKNRSDQYDLRLDWNLFTADRLFFKYGYARSKGDSVGALPVAPNPAINVGPYINGTAQDSLASNWTAIVDYVKVISPTTVNEITVGALRTHLDIFLSDSTLPVAEQLGLKGVNITDLNRGIPVITMPGFMGAGSAVSSANSPLFGSSSSYPELFHAMTYEYKDTLTITKHTHTLKFGASFVRDQFNGHTSLTPRGIWDFNGQFTRQVGSSTTGTALADFALGAFASAQRSVMYGIFGARRWRTAVFAEDNWRVTNRLTLNLGLRHEYQSWYKDVSNRWSNLDYVRGTIILPNFNNRCGDSMMCPDTNNFAPRLGIAYTLTSDGKTVLRTGSGFSYYAGANGGKMLHLNPPMSIIQSWSTNADSAPTMLLGDGLPLPVQPDLKDPSQLTQQFYPWDPRMRAAKAIQWSFGIQRQLMSDLMIDVSYVGSRTLNMNNLVNVNQALPGPGDPAPRRMLYKVNPALVDVPLRASYGGAKYHSLQSTLTKRYGYGLSGGVAFTWSHFMSSVVGPNANSFPQDSRCYRCEWGNDQADRRLMLVINHQYQLPFGPGRRFANQGVLAHVVGNWNLAGVWFMYSGTHFDPRLGTSVSGSVTSPTTAPNERPNLNGPPNLPKEERTITRWFNVPAFSVPAAYTFGNAGKGILEGPGVFQTDLGLHRIFVLKEGMSLRLRWDMYNAFNHTNFSNPNASIGTPSAGVISSTGPARSMQLALKLDF